MKGRLPIVTYGFRSMARRVRDDLFQRKNVVVDVECSSRNLKSLEHVYRYRNLAARTPQVP